MAERGAWAAAGARGGGAARARRVLPAPRPRARRSARPAPAPRPGRASPLYLLYHSVGAEMRGQALARAAAAAAPRGPPGRPGCSAASSELVAPPGTRDSARQKGPRLPRAAGRAGGARPRAPTPRRGRPDPGPLSVFTFSFLPPVPNSAGSLYFGEWRRQGRSRGDLGQFLVSAARWHPREPEK